MPNTTTKSRAPEAQTADTGLSKARELVGFGTQVVTLIGMIVALIAPAIAFATGKITVSGAGLFWLALFLVDLFVTANGRGKCDRDIYRDSVAP